MSSININLPEALQAYLKEQLARRGYKDESEFVQNLLEQDRHRQVKQDVEAMLLETTGGPFEDWTDADVEDIRTAGRRIIERRRAR